MNQERRRLSRDPIRVLLVAEHQLVQDGFKLLIESSDDFIVSTLTTARNSIAELNFDREPEVAVLSLPEDGPVDLISMLLEKFKDLRIVVIVPKEDLDLQAKALELGAVGIVNVDQNPSLLIEAIRQTYAGETWLNQVLLSKVLRRNSSKDDDNGSTHRNLDPKSNLESLTSRELEVLDLIGTGLKNKEIAEQLKISEPTVRCHLSSIYGKLGVKDRLNLVIKAYQIGLLEI